MLKNLDLSEYMNRACACDLKKAVTLGRHDHSSTEASVVSEGLSHYYPVPWAVILCSLCTGVSKQHVSAR